MNFLIDTNILIPLEPSSSKDLHDNTVLATNFHRLITKTGNTLFLHPASEYDITNDKDKARARVRKILSNKYGKLPSPPTSDILPEEIIGNPPLGSNDWVDNQLLATIKADAADYLVTEDIKIHAKSKRLGFADRILLLSEAVNVLEDLFEAIPTPPPAVESVYMHELDSHDPIFNSLRKDYKGFDKWLNKIKREHRRAYIVKKRNKNCLAAICIYKEEDVLPDGREGKVLKLCTVKVAEDFKGNKYGELIIKAIFDYAGNNNYEHIYFTVFPKYKELIVFAQDFGFYKLSKKPSGELIFVKDFEYKESEKNDLSPLEFNIKYGPFVTSFEKNKSFIIPIKPGYHSMLFPEIEKQRTLFPGLHPCGNSIKKAYLCHSRNTMLNTGDNIFFYRSKDLQALTVLGIVEDTIRSSDANEVARYVGKRTVYDYKDIKEMCSNINSILAIRFRLVIFIENPIKLDTLIVNEVIKGSPQSVVKIGGNIKWLREKIGM